MDYRVDETDGIHIFTCTGVSDRGVTRNMITDIETRIRRRHKKFMVDLSQLKMAGKDIVSGLSSVCTKLRGQESRMVIVTADNTLRELMEKAALTRLAYVCRTRQEAEVELKLREL